MMLSRSVEILGDLIAFPTISPESNLDMIDYLADRFEATGVEFRGSDSSLVRDPVSSTYLKFRTRSEWQVRRAAPQHRR